MKDHLFNDLIRQILIYNEFFNTSLFIILFFAFGFLFYRFRKIKSINDAEKENLGKIKENDEKIRESLKEKEILLQEIHHRVKNNLQIITSLLSLQSSLAGDNSFRKVMINCQNRVRSMALVHEMLYQSRNLSEINFREYIERLVMELQKSFGMINKNIKINIAAENINIDVNRAIPCALIINELVSNSFKHAFPGRRGGNINLEFRKEDGYLHLAVIDDGIGFRHNLKQRKRDSLGIHLVVELCSQINGDFNIDGHNGTKVVIQFGSGLKREVKDEYKYPGVETAGCHKILIVEDERITAAHLRKILESSGYKITSVESNGDDAVKSIAREKPDVILMDIFLQGDKTGIDTVKEIKKDYDIPFIYLSANTDSNIKDMANETGPAGYLSKPVDTSELFYLINFFVVNKLEKFQDKYQKICQ